VLVGAMEQLGLRDKIHVDDETLTIESFKTTAFDVVSYFRDNKPEEYDALLDAVLRAGTIALRSVTVAEKIDYIQKAFGELDNNFSLTLKDTIQQLDQRYEDYFGEKGKISEVINAHFGENGKIVKEIFDPNKDGTPLFLLLREFKRELSDLREKLGIKEETEQIKLLTPLKGHDFEATCEEKLSEIARLNGDELENATEAVGAIPHSKKGDYVVTLAGRTPRRIVFELKNVSEKFSPAKIHESLEQSMKNRQAAYGVFVVKDVEALPESIGWFNECADDQLVCALSREGSSDLTNLEILFIAYRWAKLRLLVESVANERMDADKIKEFVDELKNQLQKFTAIKTQCGAIQSSAKKIKDISDELKEQIDEGITRVLKIVSEEP
jgi:polyhydroxyalkanoate synthesis regulator phasin